MKKLEQNKVKVIKVNKMSVENLRSKIKQLIGKKDHSLYLTHLLLRAYTLSPIVLATWLKQICNDYRLSKQQEARYLWILVRHQNENSEVSKGLKYKDFLSVGDWCL